MTPGRDEVGVRLRAKDTRKFNADMKTSASSVRGVGDAANTADKKGKRAGKGMTSTAVGAGAIAKAANVGALALGGIAVAAIKVGANFDQRMAQVRAVSGATGEDFKMLRTLAIDMGAQTKFSASQAADAMYELSSAGITTKNMGSTLRGTLSLAAASGIELADAAEIQAAALGGFRLQGSQAGHVADVLAQSTADSALKMSDLQYSMKYIGPIAVATGQSFETMVAALEIMGNAGIKGEQAGTTLRGALTRLTNPTKAVKSGLDQMGLSIKDLQGPHGLKPMPKMLDIIRKKTAGMSVAQRNQAIASTFGTEALSGMQALLNASPGEYQKLIKGLEKSDGSAGKMAKTMNDTVPGALDQAKGSAETLGIKLYDVASPTIKAGLLALADVFNFLGSHSQATTIAIGALVGMLALFYAYKGVAAVVRGIGLALEFMRGLCVLTRIQIMLLNVQTAIMRIRMLVARGALILWNATMVVFRAIMTAARTAMLLFNLAMLANPVGLIILGIIALVALFVLLYNKVGWFRAGVQAVWGWIKAHWPLLLPILLGPIGLAALLIMKNWNRIKSGASAVWNFIRSGFNKLAGFFGGLRGRFTGALNGIWNGLKSGFRSAVNWIIRGWNNLEFHLGGTDLGPLGHVPEATISTPNIPELAGGGIVRMAGAAIVGDQGPEVLRLPGGARVDPLPTGVPNTPALGAGTKKSDVEAPGDFDDGDDWMPEFHLYIDGKEVAVSVRKHAGNDEARR